MHSLHVALLQPGTFEQSGFGFCDDALRRRAYSMRMSVSRSHPGTQIVGFDDQYIAMHALQSLLQPGTFEQSGSGFCDDATKQQFPFPPPVGILHPLVTGGPKKFIEHPYPVVVKAPEASRAQISPVPPEVHGTPERKCNKWRHVSAGWSVAFCD